jgi:hypothetical protein
MEDNRLLIPSATEAVIDPFVKELNHLGLRKEIAVFLLGSLVYQTPDEGEYRSFSSFVKQIDKFEKYLEFFLEQKILNQRNDNLYRYCHDLDHERFLEPYEFDSVTVVQLIQQEFKSNVTHFESAYRFRFTESDLKDFYPPF